jgi:hypothetical protein
MKYFFNCILIVVGILLCLGYLLTKNQVFHLATENQMNVLGLVAVFGAALVSTGLLNIFMTFYIADESKK